MSGSPANLASMPVRTSAFPVRRRPLGSGPLGVSKTQSSVKNSITASASCWLNAARKACRVLIPTAATAMSYLARSFPQWRAVKQLGLDVVVDRELADRRLRTVGRIHPGDLL